MKLLFIVFAILVLIFGFIVFRGAPYVPSRRRDVRRAFKDLYELKKDDVLVDIGSGDGIVLREAVKAGAGTAIGIELNPVLVLISRFLSRRDNRISVRMADFWLTKLPSATTIVYAFGESRDIEKMAKRVQREAIRMGCSIHFMSYGFSLKDERCLIRHEGAHYLYKFDSLQSHQA